MNLIDRAAEFAAHAHHLHLRKNATTPYFSHCCAVAIALARAGESDAVVAAGLCHDVPEDTAYSLDDIEETLGPEVALLVSAVTEPPKTQSWRTRKQWILDTARSATSQVRALLACDKAHNLRCIAAEQQAHPTRDPFAKLNAPRAEQAWFYRSLAALLDADNTAPSRALRAVTDEVFGPPSP